MSAATGTDKAAILDIGTVIADKWVVLDFIGKGAMGEVYRAHQINLQRDVAIKVVSREWLQSFDEGDQEVETSLQRFRREVQAMAQIRHPNVIQVYDHGTVVSPTKEEQHKVEFLAMEYIPGHNLRFTMSEEGFYPEEEMLRDWLRRYFIPVLNGVEAVHLLEVVHRDLKPENILLDGDNPKIADFGLARSRRMRPVTQSMDMKGTLHYMSPEHFFDFRKADQRADIYSLGKILFEAVNGKFSQKTTPFRQVSLPETETALFRDINQIILEATAEKIDERTESVVQMRRAVETVLRESGSVSERKPLPAGQPGAFWHRPRWIWAGVAAALISMAAMTTWHLMGEPGKSLPDGSTAAPSEPATARPGQDKLPGDSSPSQEKAATNPQPAGFPDNGSVLRPIAGGSVSLPEAGGNQQGRITHVGPFLIEEAPVTNHQFLDFLNSRISTLTIARGVVQEDKDIWLILGQVMDGYEPIAFRGGRFVLRNAGYASLPVLRVTPHGASAYAAHYGRRLPTRAEWYLAVGKMPGTEEPAAAAGTQHTGSGLDTTDMDQMHARMLQSYQAEAGDRAIPSKNFRPEPITSLKLNENGLRVMGSGFGEWAIKELDLLSVNGQIEGDAVLLPDNVSRKPWEAFERVGFRCVRPSADPDERKNQTGDLGTDIKLSKEGRPEK